MKKVILFLLILFLLEPTTFADDGFYTVPEDFELSKTVEDTQEEKSVENVENLESSEINSISGDEQKIKAWAKKSSKGDYLIIDKKNCSATVYKHDGDEVKTFEVGIGKEIGDDYNDTYGVTGKRKNTTPAGEYALVPNVYNTSAYGDLTLSLGSKACKAKGSKKVVAMHKIPKFRMKDRFSKFYDGNLKNNRMSHGCINFVQDDFEVLKKYIKAGSKVYILPEEADNALILSKNEDGEFELTQTKY